MSPKPKLMKRPERTPGRSSTTKAFRVDLGQPIMLQIVNHNPDLASVKSRGKALVNNRFQLSGLESGAEIKNLDIKVNLTAAGRESAQIGARRLVVDIRSGDRVYRDTILPDFRGTELRYRFFSAVSSPGIIWCRLCDDFVSVDKDGKCCIKAHK